MIDVHFRNEIRDDYVENFEAIHTSLKFDKLEYISGKFKFV